MNRPQVASLPHREALQPPSLPDPPATSNASSPSSSSTAAAAARSVARTTPDTATTRGGGGRECGIPSQELPQSVAMNYRAVTADSEHLWLRYIDGRPVAEGVSAGKDAGGLALREKEGHRQCAGKAKGISLPQSKGTAPRHVCLDDRHGRPVNPPRCPLPPTPSILQLPSYRLPHPPPPPSTPSRARNSY